MIEREIILMVGAEGGCVTLYGVRNADGWRYKRSVTDQTPLMLDEKEIHHESTFTSSWDEALILLDRYHWSRLHPIRVHPEFRTMVWSAVQERTKSGDERSLERWRDRCDV